MYAACQTPLLLTLRVTSRISTGASLRERSFLWTHRKLTSEARSGRRGGGVRDRRIRPPNRPAASGRAASRERR